jgi:hypothetical protein
MVPCSVVDLVLRFIRRVGYLVVKIAGKGGSAPKITDRFAI